MQTWNWRFKPFPQDRITVDAGDGFWNSGIQEFILGYVNLVAGAQKDMVNPLLTSVIKANGDLTSLGRGAGNRGAQPDWNFFETIDKPPCACRADSPLSEFVLQTARQVSQQVWPRHKLAKACRPDIGRRIEQLSGDLPKSMMKGLWEAALKPVNPLRPSDHLNTGTALMQQSGGFERALSTSNDQNALSIESTKITMFWAVGSMRTREVPKFLWAPCERPYARSNDHALRVDCLAVFDCEAKSLFCDFHVDDSSPIHIGYCPLMIPLAVLNKLI
jgi:hypothetical protein